MRPGSYITPDGNYSGKEADNKLALPKDEKGNDRKILKEIFMNGITNTVMSKNMINEENI